MFRITFHNIPVHFQQQIGFKIVSYVNDREVKRWDPSYFHIHSQFNTIPPLPAILDGENLLVWLKKIGFVHPDTHPDPVILGINIEIHIYRFYFLAFESEPNKI